MARDIQVRTLSRNLLRKYGLGPKKTEEQGGQVQGTSGGPSQAGRTAMTKERKEMIKGGSFKVAAWAAGRLVVPVMHLMV